jgi:hypothetical protein
MEKHSSNEKKREKSIRSHKSMDVLLDYEFYSDQGFDEDLHRLISQVRRYNEM